MQLTGKHDDYMTRHTYITIRCRWFRGCLLHVSEPRRKEVHTKRSQHELLKLQIRSLIVDDGGDRACQGFYRAYQGFDRCAWASN